MARKARPVKLGSKRVCLRCNTKFYDFEKTKVTCPKCQKPHEFLLKPEKLKEKNPFIDVGKPKISIIPTALLDESAIDGNSNDTIEDISTLNDDDSIVKRISFEKHVEENVY